MAESTVERAFLDQRPRLFRLAYRLMGTVADAEDALQDVYLNLRRADPQEVASPGAYLSRAVVRRCLDGWKSARRQRERYIGPWLPEPLAGSGEEDPGTQAELADSISLAFLVVLERLNPIERAVFLLHDVFGAPFDEIAAMVDKSPVACRQIASRARTKVSENRPRFPASPEQHRQLVGRFRDACVSGDLETFKEILTDDATVYSDGGGVTRAARAPVVGIDRVTRFLLGLRGKALRQGQSVVMQLREVNGAPGIVHYVDGRLYAVTSFEVDAGRIRRLFFVLNPEKLASIGATLGDDPPPVGEGPFLFEP